MPTDLDFRDKMDETRTTARALLLAIRGLEDHDDGDALEVIASRLDQCLAGLTAMPLSVIADTRLR